MASINRAISIRQPVVELILLGKKKAEHRSRFTWIPERVWLYASIRPSDCERAWTQIRRRPGQ